MTVIHVNLEEVRGTGGKFMNMQSQVADLVSSAKGMMGSLQGQFQGARATKIFQQWEEMQPSLTAAINTLQSAGELLNQAATDFETVDMR